MHLTPGARLGPYEILAFVGAGGMGEVYRARDPRLGRDVAIKVLRPDRATDAAALARFEREAKAIAALTHPHLLAVHDVGHDHGITFLVTELLKGESMRARLSRGPMPWRKAAEIGAEIAQGLAAAHDQGVVHRDVKPENLFLTEDGHAKILDFGLARLGRTPADAETATAGAGTDPGTVLGTAGYMSPEQVRGEDVDARADLFALGCVLHEMITGERAFRRPTAVETMTAILNEEPAEPLDSGRRMPPEIAVIVRHCLEKRAADRFQTARDLAFALRAAGTGSGAAAPPELPRTSRWLVAAAVAAAFAVVAAAAWSVFYRGPSSAGPERASLTVKRLTNTGRASEAGISRDGRLVVYVAGEAPQSTLRLMQVATGSDIELVSASALQYASPQFSRDGAYVYYLAGDPGGFQRSAYRVAAIGGASRKMIADAATTPRLSPDGKTMAFARLDVKAGKLSTAIVLANADGADERVLIPAGERFGNGELEWSEDGRELALVREDGAGKTSTLVALSVADGRERSLTKTFWAEAAQPVWLTGGRGVLILAQPKDEERQIWHVDLSSGETRRLTDSVTGYSTFSVALDGDAFVASVQDTESSMWIGRPGQSSSWQRIEEGADRLDGTGGISWAHDGQLLYGARVDGHPDILIMRPDGSDRRRLTFDGDARGPSVSPDGRVVAYSRYQAGRSNLWRMNLDGTDIRRLTDLEFAGSPAWTPDGATLIFIARHRDRFGVYRMPAGGGAEPTLVSDQLFNRASVSPDGKWLAAMTMVADQRIVAAVAPYPAGAPWRQLAIPVVPVTGVEWAPDGTIVFVKREGSSSNLWQVSMDGRVPTRLTAFDTADARRWAWGRDGRLATVRSREMWDVFLMSGLRAILPGK